MAKQGFEFGSLWLSDQHSTLEDQLVKLKFHEY